jgi:hypothetical protein
MAPQVHRPTPFKGPWLGRAALFSGALILPLALVALVSRRVVGEGYDAAFDFILSLPVVGPVAEFLSRAVLSLYFPHFLLAGSGDRACLPLGLYLVFAAIYLAKRRWVFAAVLLIVPLACTWTISAVFGGT